jgi:DNA-binding HxlR family transcriptional regulator
LRRTRFHRWPCPIARATDLVGDWWTPLVLRNVFQGQRRFEELQQSLGAPRAILARRLQRLVDEGLLRKERYSERPPRYEYRLTDKGRAFWDVLAALWRWGEDWLWREDEARVVLVDRESGRRVRPVVVDEDTGERLDVRRLRVASEPRVSRRRTGGARRGRAAGRRPGSRAPAPGR